MIGEQGGFGLVSLLRGLLGIITILGIAYAMSYDRKRIDWKLVGGGLFMQIVFALAVLYVPFVGILLEGCGKIFVKLMDFTDAGLTFLLGPYASKAAGFSFLLHSLPIVIFFSALVSMFYHWGIIQKVVGAFAWVLRKFMNISGSEGLVAAGNIFMGMTESPVLIKNYLPTMNRSEIFCHGIRNGYDRRFRNGYLHRYVGRNRPGGEGFIRHSLALGFRNGSTGFNRFSENALSADGRSHGPCSYLR